jgi:hypothetical protein
MNAYGLLEVEYSASPVEIRRAYKQAARKHHPDRHPAGSPHQRRAAETMIAVNAAFELIRHAPLRHHRVSNPVDVERPWTDGELDDAIRLARIDRVAAKVANLVIGTVLILCPWLITRLAGYEIGLPSLLAIMSPLLVLALAGMRGGRILGAGIEFFLRFRFLFRG